MENLRDSWKDEFNTATNEIIKNELIYALLMIKKAKEFWEKKIEPPSHWNNSAQRFQEQLILEIAKFYSEQTDYQKYHIPYFFQTLRKLVINI